MNKPLGQKRRERKPITRRISHSKQQKTQKAFSTVQLEALPNEVILHVFSCLEIVDLLKCGQVSQRFRAISNDEYVWPKTFNLCYKKVPVGFVQKLLDSGSKYLKLSEAFIEGDLSLSKATRLKYLNLSGFREWDNGENSETILEFSYSLQKLSLSNYDLSSKLISTIALQNGKTLKILDLSMCTFPTNCASRCLHDSICIVHVLIKQIVENCTELKELGLFGTKLCEMSIDVLVSNLTSKIEKLSLFDMSFLRDNHIKTLVTRCNRMTELNLGGRTSITRPSFIHIMEHLQLTLVKLNLQFTNVVFHSSDIFKLKSMKKLTLLGYDYDAIRKVINITELKKILPDLRINRHTVDMKIASPDLDHYGFWEIKAEQEELFSNFTSDSEKSISDFTSDYEDISD